MKQALDAQQKQIQQLMQEVRSRDQVLQQLQQRLDQSQSAATEAQSKAEAAASQAAQQAQAVTDLRTDVTDIKQNSAATAATIQETQKSISEIGSPLAIHVKGITITPGGFLAAETVWRQKALAADINTPFNGIPFDGASQNNISEFFGSGRQSRVALLAEGKIKSAKISGYVEADFLSAGVTSNNNESNSYTMRQRQAWGQAALNSGWTFTGGQMWSLVTETKSGMDNRTEALPMTIDPQYTIGFSWARQYGFRVTKNFNNKVWFGFSVENPQTTFTAHGASANFLIGSLGNGGGLYNAFNGSYSFNSGPDMVFKLAFQPPGWGHYEIFGLVSQFRDRVFPCALVDTETTCSGVTGPSAAGAFNDNKVGGGFGVNARGSVLNKKLDLGVHFLAGNGVGRYGTAGLPDTTVHADGKLALIRSYQGLGTIEFHYPKFDVYFNGGGEYAGRTAYLKSAGVGVGYGSPFFVNSSCGTEPLPGSGGFSPGSLGSNCTGDTRAIFEGSTGFWYRFYKGPMGTVQFGSQYSYIVRNAWSGTGGEPQATENMFLTSFRYYLP
ncbi:MAG TPA: hypothetical protein VMT28_12955 [Terriglobales bacterium]|jgi:hypothetical protein|nr:hypothetical protein [Terriglobales bacterium]